MNFDVKNFPNVLTRYFVCPEYVVSPDFLFVPVSVTVVCGAAYQDNTAWRKFDILTIMLCVIIFHLCLSQL